MAEATMVANFWLRPGNTASANNLLQLLESTLHHLGDKAGGLLRADNGFFDEAIPCALQDKRIPYIVAARLTQPLQRAIYQAGGWWLENGLELTELRYRAEGWKNERRLIVVRRQSVKRKTAPGKGVVLVCR